MGNILVTGAAGHLGKSVIEQLTNERKEVRALVLPGEQNVPTGDNIEVFYGNITDPSTLNSFFDCQDPVVIHCAGIVSIESRYNPQVYNVNVHGTENIIEQCKKHGAKKLIYVSSVHAIPEKRKGELITEITDFNPDAVIGLYAKTKAEATRLVLQSGKEGLNVNVVHPSGIIGPNDYGKGHLTQLMIAFEKGTLKAIVKGGYDFVDVRDVARGITSCIKNGRPNECYILANRYFKVQELMGIMAKEKGVDDINFVLPTWLPTLLSPAFETIARLKKEPPLFTSYSMHTLKTDPRFSTEKAQEILGYTNTPIETTIKDTRNWILAKRM